MYYKGNSSISEPKLRVLSSRASHNGAPSIHSTVEDTKAFKSTRLRARTSANSFNLPTLLDDIVYLEEQIVNHLSSFSL